MAAVTALLSVFAGEGCGGAGMAKSAASAPFASVTKSGYPSQAPSPGGSPLADRDGNGIVDYADRAPDAPRTASNEPLQAPQIPGVVGRSKVSPTAADAPHSAAMLIYTAHLTMAVYQVESAFAAVEQIGRDAGGYLATRNDREIVLRVPRARFEDALAKIEATGDVVHRDIQAQDVTDEFLDTEVRLRNARAMRDRLQTLLERAAVKEALEIEKELGRVTQEIERMEGRLKGLRDKMAYSTITVTFDARAASLHTMPLRLPFGWLNELGLPHLLHLHEGKQ